MVATVAVRAVVGEPRRPAVVGVPAITAVAVGELSDRINVALEDFVAAKLPAQERTGRGGGLGTGSAATGLGTGGRSLRSAFCYWGWRVFEGDPSSKAIITVAAAIELLRRYPAARRCLTWCAEMFYGCGLPDGRLAAGSLPLKLVHAEARAGEYLRVGQRYPAARPGGGGRGGSGAQIGYPMAGYAVLRPMQIGAALAGTEPGRVDAWQAFALPLGEALALREDVTGAFGGGTTAGPETTVDSGTAAGQSAGDDLREGKATVLIAVARRLATAGQRAEIEELYGNPGLDGAGRERLRSVIARSGALAVVEDLIISLVDDSLRALERLPAAAEIREVLASTAFGAFCGAAFCGTAFYGTA